MPIDQQPTCVSSPLRAGEAVTPCEFADIRRRMAMEYCKWDPQVGDQSSLAAFPLLLSARHWRQLCQWSEALSRESVAAERELLASPQARKPLALPRLLDRAIAARRGRATDWPRLMRFDFHWTTDGWQISEANADVPGGLCEASAFTAMMASASGASRPAGDPAGAWAAAIANLLPANRRDVALLTAPGYMEDHQVMAYLAKRLAEREVRGQLASPLNVRWTADGPSLFDHRPLGAIVRFVQAEWLPSLPRAAGWRNYFTCTTTPILNEPASLVIESKRFPLTWDKLHTPLPTWRALLPETLEARSMRTLARYAGRGQREGSASIVAPLSCATEPSSRPSPGVPGEGVNSAAWLYKTAFCNTGDSVSAPDLLDPIAWQRARRDRFWHPRSWIAQRRFDTVAIDSPLGPVRPCIGVYTVAGQAAGIYGRLSRGQVIDFAAIDVAVLICDEE